MFCIQVGKYFCLIYGLSVYGEVKPSKQFKWSYVKIIHFKNSLSVQLEAQKLRINILLICHIHE